MGSCGVADPKQAGWLLPTALQGKQATSSNFPSGKDVKSHPQLGMSSVTGGSFRDKALHEYHVGSGWGVGI